MKSTTKYLILFVVLISAALAMAQELVIHKTDGSFRSVKVIDIDAITFTSIPTPPDTTVQPDTTHYGRMVWIPEGSFEMGSNFGGSDEKPIHAVTLKGFYMDVYEVTNGLYKQFCDATGRTYPSSPTDGHFLVKPNYPVVNVSWEDAAAYAAWAGKSLPTEAEWEYASRGGLYGKQYPWGDETPSTQCNWSGYTGPLTSQMANFSGGSGTLPVGSYATNGYGLYDMAGNVWEWCEDWYSSTYYTTSPQQNPQGPTSGSFRVLRGGSWYHRATNVRVADRNNSTPDIRGDTLGFRCVLRP